MPTEEKQGKRPLLSAFGASLVIHLVICLLGGAWLHLEGRKVTDFSTRPHPEIRMASRENEAPVVFIEVTPADAAAERPAVTKFYSDRNSLAANPVPGTELKPQMEGQREDFAATRDNTPRPVPSKPAEFPLQPQAAAVPAVTIPPPVVMDSPTPAVPVPSTAATIATSVIEKSQESEKPLEPAPPEPPRQRPRTLSEALAQRASLASRKMKQDGSVPRMRLDSTLDVRSTHFGAYDKKLIEAVQQRWYDLLEKNAFTRDRSGKVVLEFSLHYNGQITGMQVVEESVGLLLASVCQRAVLDPQPYEPWPADMRREISRNHREVRFTFFYE